VLVLPVIPVTVTAPQKFAFPVPFVAIEGVKIILATTLDVGPPVYVVSAIQLEPPSREYINRKKAPAPPGEVRPIVPLTVIFVKPTVDVQNLRPAAGKSAFQLPVVIVLEKVL
jgi:hypothetical protein